MVDASSLLRREPETPKERGAYNLIGLTPPHPVRLSVVVPTWNAADILAPHLPRMLDEARDFPGGAEIVIVDDGSERGIELLSELVGGAGGGVRLVRRVVHSGFAMTANAGAQAAEGEYLLFLNTDMHVEPGCFSRLVRVLELQSDLFAVTPVMINLEGGFPESTIRTRFHRGVFDHLFPGRSGQPAPGPGMVRRIAYACGGALACRRDRFLGLGGFPELLSPVYWDDAGLGWVARRHGFEMLEVSDARVLHDHARTIGREITARRIAIHYERNRLLFTWVHLAGWQAWLRHGLWLPLRLAAALVRREPLLAALREALGRLGDVRRTRSRLADTHGEAVRLLRELQRAGAEGWPRDPDSASRS